MKDAGIDLKKIIYYNMMILNIIGFLIVLMKIMMDI